MKYELKDSHRSEYSSALNALSVQVKGNKCLFLCAIIVLSVLSCAFLFAQEEANDQQPQVPQSEQEIMVDDEVVDTQVEIRSPDIGVLPRKETQEIAFSLNFIRQQLMESNRRLY